MKPIDKLLKFLGSKNVAEFLDEEQRKQIAEDVVIGYQIDDDTRQDWLEVNRKAMELVKNTDALLEKVSKSVLFNKQAQVIFPLIAPAVIQMSSRLNQHLVRNGKVAEVKVLGKDQPLPELQDPSIQSPMGYKQAKARRLSEYLSYKLLIDSDTWLTDQHRLNQIVSGWGTGFKQVYYDEAKKKICSEILDPEDVIINHKISSLDKAPRITIRQYLTKNDILEQQRCGYFLDNDLDQIKSNFSMSENPDQENDSREKNPSYEFLKQYCWIDLDEDGYAEPYCAYVHYQDKELHGLYPAFTYKNIEIEPIKGIIKSIKMSHNIIDQHCIADPEGKYYSLGLNSLLVHMNIAIDSILNQLIDAGTLQNAASSTGFVTRAMKTSVRDMKIKLGQYNVLDLPPNVRIQDQIANMPFGEPSQVLLNLLQMLIDAGMKIGFMSDILTGETETQNTPATTMLAAIEQGTRTFKTVVQNLYQSVKKELKIWISIYKDHPNLEEYMQFCDEPMELIAEDFAIDDLDVVPVADPTMSSEAHKYARLQMIYQLSTNSSLATAMNPQATLDLIYREVEFPNPQALILPPSPQQPDPKLITAQIKDKEVEYKNIIELQETQIKLLKAQIDQFEAETKRMEAMKEGTSMLDKAKMVADANKDLAQTAIQAAQVKVSEKKVEVEREKVDVQRRNAGRSSTD